MSTVTAGRVPKTRTDIFKPLLAVLGLLVLAGCGPDSSVEDLDLEQNQALAEVGQGVLLSDAPNRSSPISLEGATVQGPVHIFDSAGTNTRSVRFFVDDPSMSGAPFRSDGDRPFDLAGTAVDGDANPYDSSQLADGPHTITVERTDRSGRRSTRTVTFTVANDATEGTGEPGVEVSVFNASDVPGPQDSDSVPVELGMKFRADVAGKVTGVRYFKTSGNVGPHTGKLWSAGGTLLASATFTNESATGWQTVRFSSPVEIRANQTYVVSYHAPQGRYAATDNYFATTLKRGVLSALGNGVQGGNGVYAYGPSQFPSRTFSASNYWVDVLFVASEGGGGEPPPPPPPPPPPVEDPPASGETAWSRGLAWYQANTGVPAGTTLRASGPLTITTDNTVIDGLDINGGIDVRARNVIIRNSRLTSRIYVQNGSATIERVEIDLTSRPIHWSQQHGIATSTDSHTTVRFSKIHGMQQGIAFQGRLTAEDNWIYGIRTEEGHAEAILSNGPTDTSFIRRNWLDSKPVVGTAISGPLCMYGDFGQIRNVTIDGNLMTGMGFNYFGSASRKPYPRPYNVVVTNNHFQPPFTWDQPLYPATLDPLSESQWSNNRITTTNALVAPPRGDG